ncbi:MAG: TetR/AcrR family transcriptional regulator [Gammaproteobacteria bacterium]|nr:TetR/AcrR family transcriptional regulator [Gammaproteobacteria bacterium]
MGKSHEIRKQEMVQAVLALAAEHGLSGVTTQRVADFVGVAQPTVFRHFKTREDLLRATFDAVVNGLGQQTSPIFTASGDPLVRLQQIVFTHLVYVSEVRGLPRFLFSDDLHLQSPELKARVQQVMNVYADNLASLMDEAKAQGQVRDNLPSRQTASLLIATIQGLLMRWSLADFSFSLNEQKETVWELFLTAMLPVSKREN